MHVSDQQIELVRAAFTMAREEQLFSEGSQFYDHLFKRAPHLRDLFRDDLGGQGMRFMTTLRMIVLTLNDPDALHEKLRPLGFGHAKLGVSAKDFEPMGEALMDTFRDVLGEEFTPEMDAAWRAAYAEISKRMIALGGIEAT